MELKELLKAAKDACIKAYAPYSHFRVGAALLTGDNKVITGVNVENRSFGLTNCAERTALYTALTQGISDFKAIAIYAPDGDSPTSPCGACRQVLSEFVSPDFPVIFGNTVESYITTTMGELYPYDGLHELKNNC
ncbi:MAG: cytidine deaminase [Spirochaetales bacterium]|nr:cytidine deaminase [Spirochaetales bacterium]